MARLRGPGGCPWDREQTFDTIKPYTLEEAYEVVEAIDARDWDELAGELGDLLLQVLFYAEMAQEEKCFSIDDVLDRLSNKLVDRHPHVFGEVKADTPGEVLRNWQALKAEEKKKRQKETGESAKKGDHPESVLAGVSTAMPSLMEAYKISSRVAHVGFDWPNLESLFEKLDEEMQRVSAVQSSTVEVLRALGLAYVRFATENPELYRIATMGEWRSGSNVDSALASSAFEHMCAAVGVLMDEGVFPRGDATAVALELWSAAHGAASLLIAKPHLPFGDAEAFTDRVLRAVFLGHMVAGLVEIDDTPEQVVAQLTALKSSVRGSS